jgi:hypothetical protein
MKKLKDKKSTEVILKARDSSAGQSWLNRTVNWIDKKLGRTPK